MLETIAVMMGTSKFNLSFALTIHRLDNTGPAFEGSLSHNHREIEIDCIGMLGDMDNIRIAGERTELNVEISKLGIDERKFQVLEQILSLSE